MAWLLLIGAALLEVVWALALDRSDGFTRFVPAAIGVTGAVLSFAMLTFALRDLPTGTAYAVWVGLGAVGVAVAGILALGESASPARLACLFLILAGVVGLKLAEG
ncbi:DMT family transporter [Spongiactinospora sp. 9N601]|uniref:DMT family transporter n=1 Tax=Spongiactinospora sp. 9N601 TaxID=3375149 RepID=UPI0037A8FE2D